VVNKQTGQWGTEYDAGKDLGRVEMAVAKADPPLEVMAITLKGEGNSGTLTIAWDKLSASVPLAAK